jgi:predicted RNase H-like HicB family nuclease
MIFRVSLEPSEGGWIVALSAMLPGLCKASGDEKEARENIKEANYRLAGGREAESG